MEAKSRLELLLELWNWTYFKGRFEAKRMKRNFYSATSSKSRSEVYKGPTTKKVRVLVPSYLDLDVSKAVIKDFFFLRSTKLTWNFFVF